MTGQGRAASVALAGLAGRIVEVEAALTSQKPGLKLVGLPDTALREAQARVRSAIEHAGFEMPTRHLTVNLTPAALPKHGAVFDVAIAVAVLVSSGLLDAEAVGDTVYLGELGLDGRLRPVPGVLPAVRAARRSGRTRIVVPSASAVEASLQEGIEVVAVPSLRELAIRHGAPLDPVPVVAVTGPPVPAPPDEPADLAEVLGNDEAVEALVVAAAGGHHLLMVGPPGVGKTMLATRLPGLLPDLAGQDAVDATCIASLTGEGVDRLRTRPPWQAPHHTASTAAIVGGGSGRIVPGAATLASGGVLFLDEAPQFATAVLDALRQPLESGRISIDRAAGHADFPSRFQLVLAANPCPCGLFSAREASGCTCAPAVRSRYLQRISGPLMDRIDIRLAVHPVTSAQARVAEELPRTTTAAARARVASARERAAARLAGTPWRANGQVPGERLQRGEWRLPTVERRRLDAYLDRGALSRRGYDRVIRLAWTLADLAGADRPGHDHVAGALRLRSGDA